MHTTLNFEECNLGIVEHHTNVIRQGSVFGNHNSHIIEYMPKCLLGHITPKTILECEGVEVIPTEPAPFLAHY